MFRVLLLVILLFGMNSVYAVEGTSADLVDRDLIIQSEQFTNEYRSKDIIKQKKRITKANRKLDYKQKQIELIEKRLEAKQKKLELIKSEDDNLKGENK